jgi:glutamyl/glutaminyl-tRNA synthetase
MEDTDKERSKPENEKEILESLKWLGLEHDEFIRQSDNLDYH